MFQKWYTLMERDLIIGLIAVFGGGFVLGLIAAAEFFRGISGGASKNPAERGVGIMPVCALTGYLQPPNSLLGSAGRCAKNLHFHAWQEYRASVEW